MTRLTAALALALAGVLALTPAIVRAADDDSLETLVIEMAHDQGQHEALARHFHAKAEEARAEARRHERMGKTYGVGKIVQKQAMEAHCKKIAEKLEATAAEYDAMARLHEEAAKK